ncbi:hypothetical protein ACFL2D_02355 [Patescibacteria group bacterium]
MKRYSSASSSSGFPVRGAPRVIIPHEIFERNMGWMNATDDEVKWYGLGDWNEKEFRVTTVFFPYQEAQSAHVRTPTARDNGDMSIWITKLVKEGKWFSKNGECRYKMHMHKHPGTTWGSLFESGEDEGNTTKFGLRKLTWMLVGRAVENGKYRIALEVYEPFRLSIDHLHVYVEYKGNLYRVSEPGKTPVATGSVDVELKNESMLHNVKEDEKRFAPIEIKHIKKTRVKTPITAGFTYRSRIKYAKKDEEVEEEETEETGEAETAGEGAAAEEASPGNSAETKTDGEAEPETAEEEAEPEAPEVEVYYEKKTEVGALRNTPPENSLYCELVRQEGSTYATIIVPVGPWRMSVRRIRLQAPLPILTKIRKEAAEEVEKQLAKPVIEEIEVPETLYAGNYGRGYLSDDLDRESDDSGNLPVDEFMSQFPGINSTWAGGIVRGLSKIAIPRFSGSGRRKKKLSGEHHRGRRNRKSHS